MRGSRAVVTPARSCCWRDEPACRRRVAGLSRVSQGDVPASRLQLPPGPWATVLEALCERFPAIDRTAWLDRFARGRVLDADGRPLAVTAPYRTGAEIRYFREVADEPRIPVTEAVLHVDAHLVVADKPHFLPVAPTGAYVRETLVGRLVRRLGNQNLVPLHRIDRLTAGLVLFSANRDSRARYHALFRERRIDKAYLALAPPLPALAFPQVHRSRLERGEPFFRMREVVGEANSETWLDVVERGERAWCYRLRPVSGRKHQLRVHMAALGAPILNDPLYPELHAAVADDHARPLQLLAHSLAFDDPLDGRRREFSSGLQLADQSFTR
ncbi:pseudouridylate synthase [Luteimonas sp. MC1782]|uniref:pseudouridine synthase n=1 Tax=Luteimonas sp. MC1782 TaxID=2760305 RepID=UPI0016004645|nr:pseudouridine synthase [Luteimonas sp. MC1782]MBB1471724.1 pseudouridylate synthase [Luteimonas sp. MC1782]